MFFAIEACSEPANSSLLPREWKFIKSLKILLVVILLETKGH